MQGGQCTTTKVSTLHILYDFNAKLGGGEANKKFADRYGLGMNHERGERLATVAETNKSLVGNKSRLVIDGLEVLSMHGRNT